MKIGIIGVGCVGSVIAANLIDNTDETIYLIADEKRKIKLEQNGFIVNDKKYNIPFIDEKEEILDLVIVCVKNYQLVEACNEIKKYINKNTIILPLLNGISPTEVIQQCLDVNEVLYGYITKIDSCRINSCFQYNIAGEIHFGHSKNLDNDNICLAVRSILVNAGFTVSIDEDMIRGIWKKWMLNLGANQISALTDANYCHFSKISEVKSILRDTMNELLTLAMIEHVDLKETDVDELIQYLTSYPYPKKTSMLQDVQEKRKTEIETISGDLLRLSEKWNIPCPVNRTLFNLIRIKEQVYLDTDFI